MDKDDELAEYEITEYGKLMVIEAAAVGLEHRAEEDACGGNFRGAQVWATLAVSARLEALSYAVRRTTTAGTESARANSTKGEQL
jgi:hypothetical protein